MRLVVSPSVGTPPSPGPPAGLQSGPVAVVELDTGADDVIHSIATRIEFDTLFQQGASVTAGAPSELKFLIDRSTGELYFLPPRYAFHFDFYRQVLQGPLDNAAFNEHAYNRPDRDLDRKSVV